MRFLRVQLGIILFAASTLSAAPNPFEAPQANLGTNTAAVNTSQPGAITGSAPIAPNTGPAAIAQAPLLPPQLPQAGANPVIPPTTAPIPVPTATNGTLGALSEPNAIPPPTNPTIPLPTVTPGPYG
jgi:hypothetical protein